MAAANPPPGMQTRMIELHTVDGVMRGKVAVTTGPMRLTGLLPAAFALTNALVERANGLEVRAGRAISCRAGCAACCRHMVPVSPPEAFGLLDVLDGLVPRRRAEVHAQFQRIEHAVISGGMLEAMMRPPPTDESSLPIARRYFALQLACPFLENEACGIHPQRPTACRDYNVTSPATWCASPYDNEIAKVPMPLPLSVPLARAAAALVGGKPQLIPLSLVPRWAREHAELRTRTWPGAEVFDAFEAELRSLYTPE
ncbi:MAG: YkgJ family cysteine cluster protein [Phycisphaerae bacterium]